MTIYLTRGVEFRDNDVAITGEALLKRLVQKHDLIVYDSEIRVVRVRQDGKYHHHQYHHNRLYHHLYIYYCHHHCYCNHHRYHTHYQHHHHLIKQ